MKKKENKFENRKEKGGSERKQQGRTVCHRSA